MRIAGIAGTDVGRAAAVLAAPAAVLAAAWLLALNIQLAPRVLVAALRDVPYLVLGAGVLLGWRFNRARAVFLLALVALAHGTVAELFTRGLGRGPGREVVYPALALLLPLNLAVFALLRERGVLTAAGLERTAGILLQVLAVAAVATGVTGGLDPAAARALQAAVAGFLDARPFPGLATGWTPLPQPALLAFAAGGTVLALRFAFTHCPLDAGALGALAACGLALDGVGRGLVPTVFFVAAALVVAVAVIQDSYRMAFLDELTGLPGRRALMHELHKLSGRFAVAMLDVDHFKKFNDTWGHDVGDQVLRLVAARLAETGGGGRAFRYGGEEFTVLFPGKDATAARPHLEALRRAVEGSSFALRGRDRPSERPAEPAPSQGEPRRLSVTISIGVADGAAGGGPEAVLRAADQALYRAKEGGRNRIAE
jgi:diguanylate cyclase (GGDEF)-like protein